MSIPLSQMPKRVQTGLQNVITLLNQGNIKQSEIELKKLIKKHKEFQDSLIPKALTLYYDVYNHRRENFDAELSSMMEAIKTIDEKDDNIIVPCVMADTFEQLHRPDKAAQIHKLYLHRRCSTSLLQFVLEYMITLFDFDEHVKTALKLFQMEKSAKNKFQVCVAVFVQAASKKDQKEREMGFEFVSRFYEKILADDPENRRFYLQMVKRAKIIFAEKSFLVTEDPLKAFELALSRKTPESEEEELIGTLNEKLEIIGLLDADNDVGEKVEKHQGAVAEESGDSNAAKIELLNKDITLAQKTFNYAIDALMQGPRTFSSWQAALVYMRVLSSKNPKHHSVLTVAGIFRELEGQSSNRQFEKDDLLACISFMNCVKEYDEHGIGNREERIKEFIERFGHEFYEHPKIFEFFESLTAEDKKEVMEKNTKIMAILKPYMGKQFPIGIDTVVIDGRFEFMDSKDIVALGNSATPDDPHSLLSHFYHRCFLADMFEMISSPIRKVQYLEKMVDKWVKIIDQLVYDESAASHERTLTSHFIFGIIDRCFANLNQIFQQFDNFMYLEIAACFLRRQFSEFPGINSTRLQVYEKLGFTSGAFERAAGAKIFNMSTLFVLEHSGCYRPAIQTYGDLFAQNYYNFLNTQTRLKDAYSSGLIGHAIKIYRDLNAEMNSIRHARYFSRQQFLEAAFTSSSSSHFYNHFFRNSWPTELPSDSSMESSHYCSALAEIQTVRILCHFLVIFADYKKDALAGLKSVVAGLDQYLSIISAQNPVKEKQVHRENQPLVTSSNMFENAVNEPVMKLICIYVKSIVTVLSQPGLSVGGILAGLPSPAAFQSAVNGIAAILQSLFRQKGNYVQRIRAMSDLVKMTNYMSHLIVVSFQAIAKYLGIEVRDFGQKKEFEALFIRFRQFSVELKLLMQCVESLGKKFILHLSKSSTIAADKIGDQPGASEAIYYGRDRCQEYQSSVLNMIQETDLCDLVEVGLLKSKKTE